MGRNERDDSGITLVELLVAMAITGVLLAMLAAITVGALRSTSKVDSKNSANTDARVALATMTQSLRVAQPLLVVDASGNAQKNAKGNKVYQAIVTATPSSITFYASLSPNVASPTIAPDPLPTRVTYAFSTTAACLQQTTVQGAANTNAAGDVYYTFNGTPATRCLASGTVNADGVPLFTYLTFPDPTASATAQLVSPTTVPATGSGVTSDKLAALRQINVHLALTNTKGAATSTTGVDSTVTLVNTLAKGSR